MESADLANAINQVAIQMRNANEISSVKILQTILPIVASVFLGAFVGWFISRGHEIRIPLKSATHSGA